MNIDVPNLLRDIVCGGLASAGFGVLFNVGFRSVPWCAAAGMLALLVRTITLQLGLSFEAASLVAALVVGFAVQLLPFRTGVSRHALHVVGCIPMIPGAFAARAVLGLFAITVQPSVAASEKLITALLYGMRVILTVGALGTGLAIPTLLLPGRDTEVGLTITS